MSGPRELRFLSYLSPSFPQLLYERLARHVAGELGLSWSLRLESARSGPVPGEPDPFGADRADVGFLCAPSYVELREREPASVVLAGAAPVFADPRNDGRPVLHSDVVVRAEGSTRSFDDLRGKRWAYNDPGSLSGYHCVLRELAARGEGAGYFAEMIAVGTHGRSVRAVLEGRAEAAAIDSNVLFAAIGREPGLATRLRVIASWGPYPVQPVVLRSGLPERLRADLTLVLLNLARHASAREWMEAVGLVRFAPVTARDYDGERDALGCGVNAGTPPSRT